jgi:hypothetical protein
MGAVYFISKSKGAVDPKRLTTTGLYIIIYHKNKNVLQIQVYLPPVSVNHHRYIYKYVIV